MHRLPPLDSRFTTKMSKTVTLYCPSALGRAILKNVQELDRSSLLYVRQSASVSNVKD